MRPQSTFNGNYNYYYWRRYPNIRLLHQPGTQAYILLYIHSLHASVNNYMGFTSCYNQKAKRLFQYYNRLPFTLQIQPVKSPTQTISITRLQATPFPSRPSLPGRSCARPRYKIELRYSNASLCVGILLGTTN